MTEFFGNVVLTVLTVLLLLARKGIDKILEIASCGFSLGLGRLGFLYFADGLLDLAVGALHDVLGLTFRLVEDVLLHFLYRFEFLLVLSGDVFQRFVRVADFLELFVQRLAVSGDFPEVSFNAHKLLTCTGFRIFYNGLGKSHFTCELECERVARQSHFQFEKRGYVLHVELHGSVYDTGVGAGCVEFQVRVVGGNHAVDAAAVHFAQYGFGDGSACCRLGSGTELVY